MRRSRTPTTAWPAVADLMTILAVVGLTAAAVVAGVGRPQPSEVENGLRTSLQEKSDTIVTLRHRIDELVRQNLTQQVGFVPCWPDATGGKRYFTAYDVTYRDAGYSVSRHADFERGISSGRPLPRRAAQVLREVPGNTVPELRFVEFLTNVREAIRNRYDDPECQLAVTINRDDVTGREVEVITDADFFPVYRDG